MSTPAPLATTATFVGNATVLLRLGGFTLLTDPNFLHAGERAYLGYGLTSRRRLDPAFGIEELPALDAVVLSHLHGDHFDRRARAGLPRDTPFVTTTHAARGLRRRGFTDLAGLRPWTPWTASRGDERVRVTSVPGQHGPAVVHRLLPPVMGSVIDLERAGTRVLRLYVTGDTLFRPWLAEIVDRLPDIDAMLIHLGGTRIAGVLLTMDGAQGADLLELVRPGLTLPIHHDDYTVFRSPLRDFLGAVERRGLAGVQPFERGETVSLPAAARA